MQDPEIITTKRRILVNKSMRISEIKKPYIHARQHGDNIIWIDELVIPKDMRGQGVGRKYYEEWEASLPENIKILKLMAADMGAGNAAGFWDAMGFDYMYVDDDDLDYEHKHYMTKGINGAPTPKPIPIEDEGY